VAAYAYSKGGLISVDTDGVTSTVPFPADLTIDGEGDNLGQWKQDNYSAILFWQNGIYWLRDAESGEWKEAKSRGIPKGTIPLETAMEALERGQFKPPFKPCTINTKKTRYIGYRAALGGKQFARWRRWIEEENSIAFGGLGKGTHMPVFCGTCKHGTEDMHTVSHFPPQEMESEPHHLPWLDAPPVETVGDYDLGSDFFAKDYEIFADEDLEDRL
jgi:hypothetical protein